MHITNEARGNIGFPPLTFYRDTTEKEKELFQKNEEWIPKIYYDDIGKSLIDYPSDADLLPIPFTWSYDRHGNRHEIGMVHIDRALKKYPITYPAELAIQNCLFWLYLNSKNEEEILNNFEYILNKTSPRRYASTLCHIAKDEKINVDFRYGIFLQGTYVLTKGIAEERYPPLPKRTIGYLRTDAIDILIALSPVKASDVRSKLKYLDTALWMSLENKKK